MPSYARDITRHTASIFGSRIAGLALGMVRLKLIALYLGVERFGVYSFALYFIMLFAVLYELGMQQIVIREISRDRTRTHDFLRSALTVRLALIGISFVLLLIVVALSGFSPMIAAAIFLSFGISAVQSITLLFSGVMQAHQRMGVVSAYTLIAEAGSTLMVVGLLLLGYDVYGVLWGGLAAALLALLLYLRRVSADFGFRWSFSGGASWKKILSESYPLALSSAGVVAYLYLSSSLLGYMKGEVAVGYFGVGLKILTVLSVVPASFTQVIFPILSELHESRSEKLMSMFETSVRFLLAISIPLSVGTVLLAPDVIATLFSDEFLPASDSFRILMLAVIVSYPNYLLFVFLTSVNRQSVQMILTLAMGAAVAAANLAFIPAFDLMAPSIAVVAAEVCLFVGALIYLKKIGYGLAPGGLLFKPMLAAAVMGILVWVSGDFPFPLRILIGIVAYGGTFVLSGGVLARDRALLERIAPVWMKGVINPPGPRS